LSSTETNSEQGSERHSKHANRTSWVKGQSGNPLGGQARIMRTAAQDARRDALVAGIVAEFPAPSVFELALIRAAADALENAERPRLGNQQRTRLTNSALRIIDKIRTARSRRPEPLPFATLKEALSNGR
jgi:hypothetical protein